MCRGLSRSLTIIGPISRGGRSLSEALPDTIRDNRFAYGGSRQEPDPSKSIDRGSASRPKCITWYEIRGVRSELMVFLFWKGSHPSLEAVELIEHNPARPGINARTGTDLACGGTDELIETPRGVINRTAFGLQMAEARR
jgi:hypothetical protein